MPIELQPNPSTASGYYAAQFDLESRFGVLNIARWSQLDPTQVDSNGNPLDDVPRIQASLDYADSEINNNFRNGPYAVPLVFNSGGQKAIEWATIIAGNWLYRGRGDSLDQDPQGNHYVRQLAQAYQDMGWYKSGKKQLDAIANLSQTGLPIVVAV